MTGTDLPIPYHVYKLVYLCEILDEEPAASVDPKGVGFFGERTPPELPLSCVTSARVSAFFEHRRRPYLSADFA